jgi:hypothetical protein
MRTVTVRGEAAASATVRHSDQAERGRAACPAPAATAGTPEKPGTAQARRLLYHAVAGWHLSDAAMAAAPKTMGWQLRARVGHRVRWYQRPEEVTR